MQNVYLYGRDDLFDTAAAYAFHIAEARAFIDGNKRTGAGAALMFLEVNAVQIITSDDILYKAMIDLAARRLDKAGLGALLRAGAIQKK